MSRRGGRGGGAGGIFKDRGRDVTELDAFEGPPPIYPPMENPAIPSAISELDLECIGYYVEYVEWMRNSAFFLDEPVIQRDIERYSDRYRPKMEAPKRLADMIVDQSFFPEELQGKAKVSKQANISEKDLLATIDQVAANATKAGGSKEDQGENPEEEDQEEMEDENEEEENDYGDSYFDNGEGDESDGGDDEAVY